MKSLTVRCSIIDIGGALVEGKPPTAFRIWAYGENPTDKGVHVFSETSAELLEAAQALRGNLYSVDVDHLSLSETAPPASRKAVGWHRLEVRKDADGNPELWATDCKWTDEVRDGLAKDPPEWRYFSPAYDVDPETGEIVRYLNTALTNNPATWNVTALASVRASNGNEETMDKEEMIAAFKKLAESDSEYAGLAKAALAALEPGDGKEEKNDAADGDGDGDDGKTEKDAVTTSEAPKDEEDEDKKKDLALESKRSSASKAAAAVAASAKVDGELAAIVVNLADRLGRVEVTSRKARRADIIASVEKRPDAKKFAALIATLKTSKLETVERIVAALPKAEVRSLAAAEQSTVAASVPQGQSARGTASHVDPTVKARIDEKMGLGSKKDPITFKDNVLTLGTLTPEAARKRIAAKDKTAPEADRKAV